MQTTVNPPSSRFLNCLLLWLLWLASTSASAQQAELPPPIKLEQPVAYCLTPLSDCTPEKQQPVTKKVGYDIRPLNGGKNDPITLVFDIPDALRGQSGIAILVAGDFRNHCIQLNNDRSTTTCSERQLLTLPLAQETTQFFIQNVQGDDIRLIKSPIMVGSLQNLHAVVSQSRAPVLILAGWYAFLMFASLFQLLTHRSRVASFCVAMLSLTMLARTITLIDSAINP
jgi:hypothetical protein